MRKLPTSTLLAPTTLGRLLLLPLLLTLGTASATAAPEGSYRWYDKNGTVQYTDYPPEGVESEFIRFSGTGKSRSERDDSSAKKAAGERAASDEAKPKVYDKMEVMPKKDPALCKQAKDNLKALDGARIRITEPDGTKRILTEDEKEIQRENARKFIKINC